MDPDKISAAVVIAIQDGDIPHIDPHKLAEAFGPLEGELLTAYITALVREAVSMPVEWGNVTLEQGVNDILRRFGGKHPSLSQKHFMRLAVAFPGTYVEALRHLRLLLLATLQQIR